MLKIEMMNACVAQSSGVDVGWIGDADWDSCRIIRSGGALGCVGRL